MPGTLFEEFGFNYIGPIDGHDLDALVPTLRTSEELEGPAVPARGDRKGQGYKLAEADPILYHGAGKFDPAIGIVPKTAGKPAYTQVFGDWLCDMAARRPAPGRHHAGDARRLRAGALFAGVSRPLFRRRHRRAACGDLRRGPRVRRHEAGRRDLFDLPAARLRPVDPRRRAAEPAGACSRSTAAASSAPTAPTHAGAFDLAYLRCIPNMTVMAPSDENECRQMLYTALHARYAGRRALSARRGPGRRGRTRDARAADRQRRNAPRMRRRAVASRSWPSAPCCSRRSRRREAARCHGRQHALRQAARRGTRARSSPRTHDSLVTVEENVDRGRRGQRGRRGAGGKGNRRSAVASGTARRVHRSRRSGAAAGLVRARCSRHRRLDRGAFRGTPRGGGTNA